MRRTPETVKVVEGALALGFSTSEALQRALGQSLSAFGREHGFTAQDMSMCVRRYGGRIYPEIREKLAAELEVPREYIDGVIDRGVSAEKVPA